jgi:hypothetical protein
MLSHDCRIGPERATVDTLRTDIRDGVPADLDRIDATRPSSSP